MLVSLKEISKYVDISDLTSEDIAKRLTYSGIEIDSIKKLASATNLVIGEVVSCINHPESNHLHLVKVNIGSEILDIVCGAPNVRIGLKVIVAKVGAKLPLKEIKESEIRGYKSYGMLCALNELGVDSKTLSKKQIEGIEELNDDAKVGDTNVLEYLGLDDTILDLDLLANRSDCQSLYNVAKEIGALFKRKVTIPNPVDDKTYNEINFKISSESKNCKLFGAKICKGIEVKESPKWLKDVLRSEGINSINNIVDLGNYIMLLTGQPLHMYDLDKLPKSELIVKDDKEEEFEALNEKKYLIKKGDLCVTSDNKIMCLGGVMGGLNSEISENSKNILIEAANFASPQIRKTSIRLGLSSDSSQRFIKGINKDQTEFVLNLTTNYLKKLSKVDDISSLILFDNLNHENKVIECSKDYINNRLGTSFSYETIKEVLTFLSFKIEDIDLNNFKCIVPNFRIDIDSKADLSEEVIRYLGMDNIKSILPYMETTVGGLSNEKSKKEAIVELLLNKGLNEVLTYTLISKKDNERFNFLNNDEYYEILNPLTEEHKIVRRNLLSSLLNCAVYNFNHQQSNFGIFEISKVDTKKEISEHLSVILLGNKLKSSLEVERPFDFYDMKGIVESILNMSNIQDTRVKFLRVDNQKEFHPKRSAKVLLDGKLFAVFGEIYPEIKEELGLNKESLILLEMNLSILYKTKSSNNKFIELSRFPQSTRDYAFIVKKDVEYISIKKELKKLSSLIKNIEIFDIYDGKNIKDGYISYAIRVSFESFDHTLKEDEINEIDKKIKDTLTLKFNVEIRK